MSKFSDRLSSLGQAGPARMGFGRSAEREKNPVMLLIGKNGSSTADSDTVDLMIQPEAGEARTGDWGLDVKGSETPDVKELEKGGCQFLLLGSDDTSAELLLAEDLGLGIPVTSEMKEERVRAIEDGPFDFLLYQPETISWPLTLGAVMKLQEVVSSFSKHIFLELPSGTGIPGEKELEILRNLPVSALVIDLSAIESADAKSLKVAIGKMEPKKGPANRSDRSPLVPMAGRNAGDEGHGGDDGLDDDDDDDWDD